MVAAVALPQALPAPPVAWRGGKVPAQPALLLGPGQGWGRGRAQAALGGLARGGAVLGPCRRSVDPGGVTRSSRAAPLEGRLWRGVCCAGEGFHAEGGSCGGGSGAEDGGRNFADAVLGAGWEEDLEQAATASRRLWSQAVAAWGSIAVPSVLDGYLFSQLLRAFLWGVLAFAGIALTFGVGPELSAVISSSTGLWGGLWRSAAVLALRAPFFTGFAMPAAALLAPLVVFAALRDSRELTAVRSTGVGTGQLMRPAVALFLAATAVHMVLVEPVAPLANRAAARVVASARSTAPRAGGGQASPVRPLRPVVFTQYKQPQQRRGGEGGAEQELEWLFYSRGYDGVSMLDVTALEMSPTAAAGGTASVPRAAAEAAAGAREWLQEAAERGGRAAAGLAAAPRRLYEEHVRKRLVARLEGEHGIHVLPTSPFAPAGKAQELGRGAAAPPEPQAALLEPEPGQPRRVVSAKAATWDAGRGAWVFRHGRDHVLTPGRGAGATAHAEAFGERVVKGLGRAPADLAQMEAAPFDELTAGEVARMARLYGECHNDKESRRMWLKLHQRLSMPFACLAFGCLGALISLRMGPAGGRVLGVGITLAVVFGYYATSVLGAVLGQLGGMPPWMGAWLPNFIALLAAGLISVPWQAAAREAQGLLGAVRVQLGQLEGRLAAGSPPKLLSPPGEEGEGEGGVAAA